MNAESGMQKRRPSAGGYGAERELQIENGAMQITPVMPAGKPKAAKTGPLTGGAAIQCPAPSQSTDLSCIIRGSQILPVRNSLAGRESFHLPSSLVAPLRLIPFRVFWRV